MLHKFYVMRRKPSSLPDIQDLSSVKSHMKEDSHASKALMTPLLRMENQWRRPGGTKDSSIMTIIWEPGTLSLASRPALHATFWLHSCLPMMAPMMSTIQSRINPTMKNPSSIPV